jgi:hypothetical protein
MRGNLKPWGTLNILQPNYRYAHWTPFEDHTHAAIYSRVALADFLTAHRFDVIAASARFMPLTIKSRLLVAAWLIRAYRLHPSSRLANRCPTTV